MDLPRVGRWRVLAGLGLHGASASAVGGAYVLEGSAIQVGVRRSVL